MYSDDEIQAYYEEHKDNYDLIDGAYVTLDGTPEAKTDDEGNAIEATDEEKAAALEEAKEKAQAILDAYKANNNLDAAASANGATVSTSIPSASSTAGAWFYDEARRSGDADVIADEDNSRYYVALFNSRERDETLDYNVRHILVTAENLELPEGQEASDDQIKAKAEAILASWDGTEDGFAALANENSKDGGSNTSGGLYEDVAKGSMVAAFQDWCYEDGRQPGDTGIVQSNYGYHIMYFVGYGDTQYWHYACENAMRSDAVSQWQTTMTNSATADVSASGMKQVG